MKAHGHLHRLHVFGILGILAALLTVSATTGCGSNQPTSTDTVTARSATEEPAITTIPPAIHTTTSLTLGPSTFRSPFAEQGYYPPQPVDVSAITNLDKTDLTSAEKEILAKQSFVAILDSPESRPWKFWQVYEKARYAGLPLLITTDSVLNTYHGLFDTLLQRMEEKALYGQAIAMTEALYGAAAEQWNAATVPLIKEDARRNMAYFLVAKMLLTGSAELPGIMTGVSREELEAIQNLAHDEVALIEAHAGVYTSPTLGYLEDYTQYIPRGHYTRSETLQRYFKGLMWYGHTAFYINPRQADLPESSAAQLTRRAILVASSLTGPAKAAWSAIYEPTSFLVGRADDLTVDNMRTVVSQVFGTPEPAPDLLGDAAKVNKVRQELNTLPAPKILSAAARMPNETQGREENERSFRVMGQRYIPDSYAFQQLVWPYVGTAPNHKRDIPMGLDAMAVLGSDQAYQIAKNDYAQNAFQNWESQLKKVNEVLSARTPDLWPANLYTGWLESLQRVMTKPADAAPDFMKTKAWARKSLNTALGSWTELRHDTILYAKQSVTAEGDGGEEPVEPGYVEPYPEFYAGMGHLASTLKKTLVAYGLIDSESANKLDLMTSLADTLRSISEKELSGVALTNEESATISYYGHYLETLEQFADSEEGRTLSPTSEKSPLVADVHTSYNSDSVLEEATGYPLLLYAAFKLNGRLQIFAGASYSYYEFTVPKAERLTDEKWTALLDSSSASARPLWTDEWIVER